MKDPNYWKKHYVFELDADEIERNIKITRFVSEGRSFELVYFEKNKKAPNILISPGSAGHSYVFAELAYMVHLKGYNVFIMPKQGGFTITQLMQRHKDALKHIADNFNKKIGVYAEGLGGYVSFYLALAHGSMKSIVLENGPGILTEEKYQKVIIEGKGAAKRRKQILPFAKFFSKIFPWIKIPISVYLDFEELIDTKEKYRKIETHLVKDGFMNDPDFDRSYPLSAIMSLISTPLPNPLSELNIPTMFIIAKRGLFPEYLKDLYKRLPSIKKKMLEANGSVFWMCSHKKEAAKVICEWFNKTL